ncbi:glycosyl hydrolase family 18 protein [Kitasatospora sp. NPDC059827]|uniref:glycosyl hydrolase family 18 protein n=1 Tax=Kitasatospora sp. NPDC059827 TaxID=3346964 RepID=UPI0036558E32
MRLRTTVPGPAAGGSPPRRRAEGLRRVLLVLLAILLLPIGANGPAHAAQDDPSQRYLNFIGDLQRNFTRPYRGDYNVTLDNATPVTVNLFDLVHPNRDQPVGMETGLIIAPNDLYICGFYTIRAGVWTVYRMRDDGVGTSRVARDTWFNQQQRALGDGRYVYLNDIGVEYGDLRNESANRDNPFTFENRWVNIDADTLTRAVGVLESVTFNRRNAVNVAQQTPWLRSALMVLVEALAEGTRFRNVRDAIGAALRSGIPARIAQFEPQIQTWNARSSDLWDANQDPGNSWFAANAAAVGLAVLQVRTGGPICRIPRSSDGAPGCGRPLVNASFSTGRDMYLLQGPFVARIKDAADNAVLAGGKEDTVSHLWPVLAGTPFANGFDAAFTLPEDPDEVMLFRGDQYMRMRLDSDGNAKVTKVATTIADGWHSLAGSDGTKPFTQGVDSALSVTKNQVFLFKGDTYVSLEVNIGSSTDRVLNGPKPIGDNFKALAKAGWTDGINAAVRWPQSEGPDMAFAAFFRGNQWTRGFVVAGGPDSDLVFTADALRWGVLAGTIFAAGDTTGMTKIPRADDKGGPTSTPPPSAAGVSLVNDGTGRVADVDQANPASGTKVKALGGKGNQAQKWNLDRQDDGRFAIRTALDPGQVLDANGNRSQTVDGTSYYTALQRDGGGANQRWRLDALGGQTYQLVTSDGGCLTDQGEDRALAFWRCTGAFEQRWHLEGGTGTGDPGGPGSAGAPFDDSADDRGTKPASAGDCRPEGMTPTDGVSARYCDVYDGSGREWVGNGRSRRAVGYFTGWRSGAKGDPAYLVSNIPWSKVTHVNYAFAKVEGDRISVGDVNDPKNPATGMTWEGDRNAMDPSLPYKGHFNLLNTYKKKHPAVKTLISVGGWADTRGFYAMATNADGSVNQAGIDTFADSVTEFLDRYGFNGVDIDYEYPGALPSTGNPLDWDVSDPRRKGLQQGYTALMKALRAKLDRAGADKGRYYLLTSAGSASGYLVRGLDAGQALQYQDFVNVMSYDLHGSWNKYVGPQAPLYDDGRDNELADAGIYDDQRADTKDYGKNGYFNVDWAYHYYRGALPPGRINLGIPFYSRGWQNVQGGTDGLWGTSAMPDQSKCPRGVGGRGPAKGQDCGLGATGIDNVWHDTEDGREVGAGSNPLWHTRNLQEGRTPGYLKAYGVDPGTDAGKATGTYAEKYSDPLQSSWLWNDSRKVFLSTENEKSVDAKAKYIADKGIGGAMIWELAGDYTKRANGEWGMGYDLTTRLDNALKGAGASGNATGGGKSLPSQVIDVKAELVDFPTAVADMWPIQPKLRITNRSKVALAQGTEISFDLPTSTTPVVKDGAWKVMGGITPGHSGPNAGGLKGDFHRVTIKLGYCEDVPAGKSKDIDVKYYLPVTGPANVTFRIGGTEFGSTGDRRRAVTTVDPPAPASGSQCQAAPWQAHAYNPNPSFAFWQTGDKWIIEDRNSGNVLDHPGSWADAHLSMKQAGNANQLWTVSEDSQGWYHIKSGTSGHDQCLGATTARGTLTVRDCDGKVDQWWRLVRLSTDQATAGKPMLDSWAPGGPVHGAAYALGGFVGGNDDWWKVPAYLAAPANSATASSTKIIAGDTDGAWASTVSWNGSYWRAKWWNKATDEPGRSDAWQKLGPTP